MLRLGAVKYDIDGQDSNYMLILQHDDNLLIGVKLKKDGCPMVPYGPQSCIEGFKIYLPMLPPADDDRIEMNLIARPNMLCISKHLIKKATPFLLVSYLEFTRPSQNRDDTTDLVGGLASSADMILIL